MKHTWRNYYETTRKAQMFKLYNEHIEKIQQYYFKHKHDNDIEVTMDMQFTIIDMLLTFEKVAMKWNVSTANTLYIFSEMHKTVEEIVESNNIQKPIEDALKKSFMLYRSYEQDLTVFRFKNHYERKLRRRYKLGKKLYDWSFKLRRIKNE